MNIDRVANAFKAIGVKENDVVTLQMLNQPEMVYAFYALNKIGAVTCVVNVLSSTKELIQYLQETNSRYFVSLDIFFDKAYTAALDYGVKKLIYVPMYESLGLIKKAVYRAKVPMPQCGHDFVLSWADFVKAGTGKDFPSVDCKKGKCTVIGHTGGTTGIPKGVRLTDRAFNAIISQYRYKFRYHRQETFLNMVVPFAIYGLCINLHMPLTLGITVILIPKVDPATTDVLLRKHKPNHVASIPAYWNAIAESQTATDWSWLKTAAAGGTVMTNQLEQQLNKVLKNGGANIRFTNGYGMSEVCSTACTQTYDCAKVGSVGIPLVRNILAAFDPDTLEEKKYDELGEICILSPSTMLGYIHNPTENEATLRIHKDGQTWVHTGDLGYIDQDGCVFITGRIKRIYLTHNAATGPLKLYPDRIERVIEKHKDVSECCTVCIQIQPGVYVPVSYVTLKKESSSDTIEKELHALCEIELPEYAIPKRYVIVDSLPHTSAGKVDYRTLEKEANEEKETWKRII